MTGLTVETPSTALDDALEWEKQTLPEWPPLGTSFITSSAAIALAEYDLARALILNGAPAQPASLMLAARHYAWSGDRSVVTAPAIEAAQRDALSRVYGGDHPAELVMRTEGMTAMAAVARDLGNAKLASELESSARRIRIDNAAAVNASSWVSAIPEPPGRVLQRFDAVDEAAPDLLLQLDDRIRTFPGGVTAALIFGMLGIEADAARGRIRMRPQLPAGWPHFAMRNLRVGDAAFELRIQALEGAHDFHVEQTEGPVPFSLILEPLLVARSIIGATVDGRDADLAAKPNGSRLMTSVQLVLDGPRSVQIRVPE